MALPSPRKKLQGVSPRNRSLQDIFRSSREAVAILEVIPVPIGLHNTKIIMRLSNGEQRIHFYNRLLLTDVIPDEFVSSGNLASDIDALNSIHGCDFTEDDLELLGGKLKAKPGSLGYYNSQTVVEIDYCAISTPIVKLSPNLFEYLSGDEVSNKHFRIKINEKVIEFDSTLENLEIGLSGLVWMETQGDIRVRASINHEDISVIEGDVIVPIDGPVGGGMDEIGTLIFENLSNKCYSIEILPEDGDTLPIVNEMTGNVSYRQAENNAIKFSLSPWKSLTCDMTHAKLIEFKPKDYSWKDKERVAIYARVYEDLNSQTYDSIQIVHEVADLHTRREYWVPNHGQLRLNTSVAWPTLEPFLDDFSNQFRNYEIDVSLPPVIQTNPVRQTAFLGFYKSATSTIFQSPIPLTLRLVERKQDDWSIVKDELIGSTNITASDVNDLMVKARAFFTPLLEDKGFTVETYSISDGLTMTNTGFKLTKTSVNDVSIKLENGPWVAGWGDWSSEVCYFRQVAVEGDMVTEEDLIDDVWIKLRPYDGSKPGAIQQRSRVIFTTAEGAGIESDPDTYDWIKENNNGEEIIFESCAIRQHVAE